MNNRLRELVAQIEEWPAGLQEEAVASLEAIAGYVIFHGPSNDDR
jgi:hypothetical protein